ncbi:hypothetical protein Vadar_028517 [Vaccinium darrowii]|uniref:Uncharacterized protein n=1 Tax=Vaccinium darrowii TaxID=229202 RepID=A0ACB7ZF02_9ERIC|nr:hypothetical protein Vadar_028517 [Vaccinium darrowii]
MRDDNAPCCEPKFWLYLCICLVLVSFAGLTPGLALGLLSFTQVDLEVLVKAGLPQDQKNAAKILPIVKNEYFALMYPPRRKNTGNGDPSYIPGFHSPLLGCYTRVSHSGSCIRRVRCLLVIFLPVSYPFSKLLDWLMGKGHSPLLRRAELKTLVDFHGNEAHNEVNNEQGPQPNSHVQRKPPKHYRSSFGVSAYLPEMLNRTWILNILESEANREKRSGSEEECISCEDLESLPDNSDEEVIGIITMEDVMEELLQEEILDETDEYVDVRNRIKIDLLPSRRSSSRSPGAASATGIHWRTPEPSPLSSYTPILRSPLSPYIQPPLVRPTLYASPGKFIPNSPSGYMRPVLSSPSYQENHMNGYGSQAEHKSSYSCPKDGRNFNSFAVSVVASGPRVLTGAVDLISHYKLLPHHDFFCKSSLPLSIADTHYLHNVVGDTEIRKGEGMQLDQLIQDTSYSRGINGRIQPFDLDVLREACQLRETAPIDLPLAEKGIPTTAGKSKSESKDKERKHKKHKDRDREKDKEHKKHKHRHKDRSKDKGKEKKKDKSGHHDSGAEPSNKDHEKKRKHDGDEYLNDIPNHKKSKHKSSKIEETGAIRVAG